MNHTWQEYSSRGQRLADGGVLGCVVCGGFQDSLPSECPGEAMTTGQKESVYGEVLDFRGGVWVPGATTVFYGSERFKDGIDFLKAPVTALLLRLRAGEVAEARGVLERLPTEQIQGIEHIILKDERFSHAEREKLLRLINTAVLNREGA